MKETDSVCRKMYGDDPLLLSYHDREWCRVNHDDRFEFEMLCLEGASVGLSWKLILHKRGSYRKAFHGFDIRSCASMSDSELEGLVQNKGIIPNRSKILSVRKNAQAVLKIQEEFGSFDSYIWGFTDGKPRIGRWKSLEEIPTVSETSKRLAKDMKRRGISYVGPIITYSFMQAVGMVNDHLWDCPAVKGLPQA